MKHKKFTITISAHIFPLEFTCAFKMKETLHTYYILRTMLYISYLVEFSEQVCKTHVIVLILQSRKLKYRQGKLLIQGHTARKG